jgi:TolB protein
MIGAAALSGPAHAVVELNITEGNIQPLPIAIPDFTSDGSISPDAARDARDADAEAVQRDALIREHMPRCD